MRTFDYIIYGGGPTGIALALKLQNRYNVALVEASEQLGGCWKVRWDNNLFTEHSPRVITGNRFEKFLKEHDISTPMDKTYTSPIKDYIKYYISNITFCDAIKFIFGYICYLVGYTPTISVMTWAKKCGLSEKFQNVLRYTVTLLADEKLLLRDYFSVIPGGDTRQLVYPEHWINEITKKLNKTTIYTNVSLIRLTNRTGRTIQQTSIGEFGGKSILCLSPKALYQVLERSDTVYQSNWGHAIGLLKGSYYSCISMQFHYKTKFTLPGAIKKTPSNIVIIETSRYNKEFTKRNDIQTVLSCALINGTSSNTIKEEVYKLSGYNPEYITIYDNRLDTGFVETSGVLPFKGVLEDTFLVGSYNKSGISSIDKALSVVDTFTSISPFKT